MCSEYRLNFWSGCNVHILWSKLKSSYNMHFWTVFGADFFIIYQRVIMHMISKHVCLKNIFPKISMEISVTWDPPWLIVKYHYSWIQIRARNHSNICAIRLSITPESSSLSLFEFKKLCNFQTRLCVYATTFSQCYGVWP